MRFGFSFSQLVLRGLLAGLTKPCFVYNIAYE